MTQAINRSEMARRVGYSAKAIRDWCEVETIKPYLSEQAIGHRATFTMQDQLVIMTIAKWKADNGSITDWSALGEYLSDGNRDDYMSPKAMATLNTEEVYTNALILTERVRQLEKRIDELQEDNQSKDQQIMELNREVGKLLAKLEMLEE